MPKNETMPKTYQSLQKINVLAWPGLSWLGLACHNSKKIDTNRAPAAAFGRRPLFGLCFVRGESGNATGGGGDPLPPYVTYI